MLLAARVLGLIGGVYAGAQLDTRPNIIFLLVDDLGANDVGFMNKTVRFGARYVKMALQWQGGGNCIMLGALVL